MSTATQKQHAEPVTSSRTDGTRLQIDAQLWASDPAAIGMRAMHFIVEHRPAFSGMPPGTVIVIDLATGDYITAPSRLQALDAFEARIGSGTTIGWLHQIGGGIVVGGGLG